MIEKFVGARDSPLREPLDLNYTSNFIVLVPLMNPKFARDPAIERWRTSQSGHWLRLDAKRASGLPGGD
jgi:hypothetical protein